MACPLSLDVGYLFLVSSSVFLSMIVQKLVVILVFSQEGMRARPSTSPSWFLLDVTASVGGSPTEVGAGCVSL